MRITASFVVGADGVRSTVVDRVGATVERAGTGPSAVVYGYWSDLATDGYEWIFRAGRTGRGDPTNDGRACVFAASTPRRVGTGGLDVLRTIIGAADGEPAARLAGATAPAGVRSFRGRPGIIRRAWGAGWALVRDAGYGKDPLSAHGLTDALRDAELLARAIASSMVDDGHDLAALAACQAARDGRRQSSSRPRTSSRPKRGRRTRSVGSCCGSARR